MRTRLAPFLPWIALAVGLLCMLPGIGQRIAVERANDTYEISVAYPELTSLRLGGIPTGQALDELIEAGVTSVAIDMVTIRDYEREGQVTLLGRADLLSLLLLSGESPDALPPEGDSFIVVGDDDAGTIDRIRRSAGTGVVEPISVAGQTIYQVTGIENLPGLPLGYDDAVAEEVADRGLAIIARVPSTVTNVDFAIDELDRLQREYGVDRFLLIGDPAAFRTMPDQAEEFAEWLRDADYTMVLTEFLVQSGMDLYAETVEQAVRMRNLGLPPIDTEDFISDAVRAVRERNIRILSVRPHPALDARDRLDLLTDSIEVTRASLPEELELGLARPFDPLRPDPLLVGGTVIAALAIGWLSASVIGPVGGLAVGVLAALMVAGMWLVDSIALGNLTRLTVAVMAAAVATFVAVPRRGLPPISLSYARAAAVVFVGGLTVAALAFDSVFLVGARDFWGVKALLLGPPVIVALVAAYMALGQPRWVQALPILNTPIRLWHAVAAVIVVGAVGFMLLRSGNSGIQIDIELVLREQLEQLFVVRPRTKEFLLGFPALLLAIAAAGRWRHGWWLYPVGAIATASAINTFTHFHSPLVVSLLRTAYGIGLGFLVGLILLGLAWLGLRLLGRLGHRYRFGR